MSPTYRVRAVSRNLAAARLCVGLAALFFLAGCTSGARPNAKPAEPPPGPMEPASGDRPFRTADAKTNEQVAAAIARFEDEAIMERLTAARRLAAVGDVAVPQLLAALESHPGMRTRSMAAYTLGHMGDRRVVDALVLSLGDPAPEVRYEVAAALLRLGDVRGFEPLIAGLEDPDPRVRLQAIGNLKEASGSTFGFEPDGDPIERRAAVARWRGWVQQRRETGR
jgi:hypothetical protein